MKINKQLFEDVLSGKLKGTFVLKNKQIVKSNTLKRSSIDNFPYEILIEYGNGTTDYGIYKSNGDFESYNTSYFDIIDFIPDTDMKENELTIEIPEGKIVDWEESKKQNRIVLKDKQLTYEEICDKLPGMIDVPLFDTPSEEGNALVANEHYLDCLLAKNKLANVAKCLNNGWKPIKDDRVFIIMYRDDFNSKPFISVHYFWTGENLVLFKTQEFAQQAIEILGEETVKLALEPLGI